MFLPGISGVLPKLIQTLYVRPLGIKDEPNCIAWNYGECICRLEYPVGLFVARADLHATAFRLARNKSGYMERTQSSAFGVPRGI